MQRDEEIETWGKYIVLNTAIKNGWPMISGTRLPVDKVLKMYGSGLSQREIQKKYPAVKPAVFREAVAFGAYLTKEMCQLRFG